jgi:hypothetical protein
MIATRKTWRCGTRKMWATKAQAGGRLRSTCKKLARAELVVDASQSEEG